MSQDDTRDKVSIPRRRTLAGVMGLAAGIAAAGSRAAPAGASATAPAGRLGRIDVHAHYVPERYRSALKAAGHGKPSGMPGIPRWSVADHLALMDSVDIAASMLSISAPGLHFGDDAAARELARHCNEEGARAVQAHPTRFGLFAVLPLPDVDGAMAEMAYAFDTLHADGVVMETNMHGLYPGDARLDPVFAELNRRRTALFLHPANPHCPCCRDQGELPPLGYPFPMIEFMFETTRAVFNLILSGTLARYPDIKVIVPHAGAAVPVLAQRVAAVSAMLELGAEGRGDMADALRLLYYDLAGFPEPVALRALLQVADPARVLYGSDWPFTPSPVVANLAAALDRSAQIDPAMRKAFMRENALAMFPRLGAA